MKIVLTNNRGYSTDLIKKYFELCGYNPPTFYDAEVYRRTENFIYTYSILQDNNRTYIHVSKNHLGETVDGDTLYSDENYFECDEIPRDDVNFALAVETIQPKGFRVVEIPDDVKWYIHKSDCGHEWVNEEHRTWG